jgi:DNA-binding NarL/FixJ family response regulator
MANAMSLSKRTVERHVARLMDVVAIRERASLIRLAYAEGLVV